MLASRWEPPALTAAGRYGFIAGDGENADLYFQRDAIEASGFDALRVGQRVEFDVTPHPLKPDRLRAEQIRPTQRSGAPALACVVVEGNVPATVTGYVCCPLATLTGRTS